MKSDKKKTLSFRIDPEIHQNLKRISLENDITIQKMGEVFVDIYLNENLKLDRPGVMPETNQRKLYRDADESTVTFRISEEIHQELRNRLKHKRMTFQKIAEDFFKKVVKHPKRIIIDLSNSEYNKLEDEYQKAIYVFENPYG
ncbi:hypothetical protein C8C76_14910 [Halanaerobium saccharolyticum]|uniref:Uncharacterized protein n=1 Tax=Halanaerobium saccharolyticum TaxID=43595 RepID=A0A2T5RFN0_9FIRM|nr:hypothetical protein [Halanaerobium saccharolyticum]PTV93162.1 hypothetical protein C8C76_14910 [Halanaerobium saccharolyticum]